MCEQCENTLNRIDGQIATLLDNWSYGSPQDFEESEPFFIGGLGSANGNMYSCRAPFQGPCQWSVDTITAGTIATQLVVASSPKRSGIDFTGTLIPSYQDSQMDALVLFAPPASTVPISSRWYDLRNSENTLYVLVVSASNSGGANIQFRQKRKSK